MTKCHIQSGQYSVPESQDMLADVRALSVLDAEICIFLRPLTIRNTDAPLFTRNVPDDESWFSILPIYPFRRAEDTYPMISQALFTDSAIGE